ncbi:hypothetical protein KSP40_PGU005719 [Platanthera guangdongensis]|uniref:Uncharacterized protein n=1 Tax=Platanthera guangdongensis TaxID=2320717 RepID=A0ABR2MLE1_9ASPA
MAYIYCSAAATPSPPPPKALAPHNLRSTIQPRPLSDNLAMVPARNAAMMPLPGSFSHGRASSSRESCWLLNFLLNLLEPWNCLTPGDALLNPLTVPASSWVANTVNFFRRVAWAKIGHVLDRGPDRTCFPLSIYVKYIESHIHSLMNVLRYCNLDESLQEEDSLVCHSALERLFKTRELDYMSYIVLRMFENTETAEAFPRVEDVLGINPELTSETAPFNFAFERLFPVRNVQH